MVGRIVGIQLIGAVVLGRGVGRIVGVVLVGGVVHVVAASVWTGVLLQYILDKRRKNDFCHSHE